MKADRQEAILEIIASNNVETQEALTVLLREKGFKVTQATVSRDIKGMNLVKSQVESGGYRYSVSESSKDPDTEKFIRVFREAVQDIKPAGNLVVVKTFSGGANAAAAVIDNSGMEEIIGTIAGDNTIFIAVAEGKTQAVMDELMRYMEK